MIINTHFQPKGWDILEYNVPVYIKKQSFEVKSPRDVSNIYHSPNLDNKAKLYLRI
jgi:hypothetical protein